MLKTRNIFLDTHTFIANNFFVGENLNRLAEFGRNGTVKIFLTEITINEIQSNIQVGIHNAQDEINKFKRSISSKSKILKHIDEYQKYIELPDLDLKADFSKLNDELTEFIDASKATIIPYELADFKDVVSKYMNCEKPFGLGKKKYEFPDAIVLSAIDQWCLAEKTKIYVVSGDPDLKEYSSERIIVIPKLRVVLDYINRQYESDRIKWIEQIFIESESNIEEKIKEHFEDKIKDEHMYDLEIRSVRVSQVQLYDFSIVQDNEAIGETIFQLDADISFSADIENNDYSLSFYDKEDDRWLMPRRQYNHIEMTTTQTVEISIEWSYEECLLNGSDAYDISCIYTGIPNSETIMNWLTDR